MNLQVRIVTDMTAEPVELSEVKNFCKVTGTQDDALITLLTTSARKALEKYTSSSFGEKTIHAYWQQIPGDWIVELPYGPIISVDAIYKIDEQGTEEALTLNTDYYVIGDQDFKIKLEQFWSTGYTVSRSLRVEYTAGYGNSATEPLPDELRMAIMKQVSTDYNFRDNIQDAGSTALANNAKSLAAPYRKKVWF